MKRFPSFPLPPLELSSKRRRQWVSEESSVLVRLVGRGWGGESPRSCSARPYQFPVQSQGWVMALTFYLGKGCQERCSRPQATSGSPGVGRAEVSYKPATATCLPPPAGHSQAIHLQTGGIPKIIQSHSLIDRGGNRGVKRASHVFKVSWTARYQQAKA